MVIPYNPFGVSPMKKAGGNFAACLFIKNILIVQP